MNRYHHLKPISDEGPLKRVRWWLNLLFMTGAVVGMLWYLTADHNTAVYILLGAMIPKFIEVALRILKL